MLRSSSDQMGKMEVLNEAMMIDVWGLSVKVRAYMIGPMNGLCLESRFEKFGYACHTTP